MTADRCRRYAVLDRDGTLIVDRHYLADPDGVELMPGVVAGLHALRAAGFGLVLATNQSGLARGYFDEAALARVQARLFELLAAEGLALDGVFVCPHSPDDGCVCRKPAPGLIEAAIAAHAFLPKCAVVIGDSDVDMGAARAAGVIGIRIGEGISGDYIARDFANAADIAIAALAVRPS